jgi:hypothetical protein
MHTDCARMQARKFTVASGLFCRETQLTLYSVTNSKCSRLSNNGNVISTEDCDIRIITMMEAVRTSETSVYSNETTRRYIPEDSHLLIIKYFVK